MQDSLRKKIEQLFEYRSFPELYRLSGADAAEISKLHYLLVELQARIYDLDFYLETHWELKNKPMQAHWEKIYKALDKLGVPAYRQEDYCSQIYRYQKHEADIRRNKLPTRFDMEYFYFYKSCDVKLQRRLLIERLPKLKSIFNSGDWRFFDLVTEINDDATDLLEDTTTINGNRLLISFYTRGIRQTQAEFIAFLDYAVKQSLHRCKRVNVSTFHKSIHIRTAEQAALTKSLILNPPAIVAGRKIELPLIHHLSKDVRA